MRKILILFTAAVLCLISGCAFEPDLRSETVISGSDTLILRETDGEEAHPLDLLSQSALLEKVPLPPFDNMFISSVSDTHVEAVVAGKKVEDIKAYVEEVKAFGFDLNSEVSESVLLGVTVYSFLSQNQDGYIFTVKYTSGVCTLTLTAPLEE